MKAIVTSGCGGFEKLEYTDVPVPVIGVGEVLVKVHAAAVNNTDINTRIGWYSEAEGGWDGATPFPMIQGTDGCGTVVEVSDQDKRFLIGRRILIRPCMRVSGFDNLECVWLGSNFDGTFAEYVKVPANEVFPVDSEMSSFELASFPCSYGTALNLLLKSGIKKGMKVLVTGASGGVGSAAVQLASIFGAEVTAVAGENKHKKLLEIGAAKVLARGCDLLGALGESVMDRVIDIVGGEQWNYLPQILKRGGKIAVSGAVAGPEVSLDLRDLYLKDLSLLGATAWDKDVFPVLISLIQENKLKSLVAASFTLKDIESAQRRFEKKDFVGKISLEIE